MSLARAFLAGRVLRWHAHPRLADTGDFVDGHSGRVARIIAMLHPGPSRDLLIHALGHDDGEMGLGDVPGPARDEMPDDVHRWFEPRERRQRDQIWVFEGFEDYCPEALLSQDDMAWLRFADRLDRLMWEAWCRPGLLAHPYWGKLAGELEGQAVALQAGIRIDGLIAAIERGEE